MLKSDSAENPLPAGFKVERIFHTGHSQQGGSLITYATAFHFPVNDGYFISGCCLFPNVFARRINFGPVCSPFAPPYPDCTPLLPGDARQVRTDLPVPVYQVQSETDISFAVAEGLLAGQTRQEDNETFRYYEMAGTAHLFTHKDQLVLPPEVFPPNGLLLEDACLFPINTLVDGPVFGSYLYNAMWENMELQVRFGVDPPHGDLIETDPVTGEIARDEFGNALGGIRLPDLDVPIATYGPHNTPDPSLPSGRANCNLRGTVADFDDETLDALYPLHETYVSQVAMRTDALQEQRFLLPEDGDKLKLAATRYDRIPDDRDNCIEVANSNQRDTDNDGFGNVCDPDLNGDLMVDFLDLGLLKSVFFTADEDADLNGDGSVDFLDLGLMKSQFFQPPGPSGLSCAGTIPCP